MKTIKIEIDVDKFIDTIKKMGVVVDDTGAIHGWSNSFIDAIDDQTDIEYRLYEEFIKREG